VVLSLPIGGPPPFMEMTVPEDDIISFFVHNRMAGGML